MNTMSNPTVTGCCAGNTTLSKQSEAGSDLEDSGSIRTSVRNYYADRATGGGCGCGGNHNPEELLAYTSSIGYSVEEQQSVPEGANLGLGCGNPTAIETIPEGSTVLDLGSGAGFDCFLAARKVGPTGRVIGVDMTPEMIDRARDNARRAGFDNVEFRLGEIESLPVGDASVDVIISNCVINLSPEKERVFAEAFRVLRPGGRLMVSDIVLTGPLPEAIRQNKQAYAECVSGAESKDRYLSLIGEAGFSPVQVVGETDASGNSEITSNDVMCCSDGAELSTEGLPAVSIRVTASKPN